MNRMRVLGLLCLLLSALPVRAQFFEDKGKKEAKELFENGKKEDADRVKQVKDLCEASQLAPKEKKFAEACTAYRTRLTQEDAANLAAAVKAYQARDMDKAETLAKQVSNYDPGVFAQARSVLEEVRNEKFASTAIADIKAAWEKGDFDTVMALSQTMTTPSAKNAAALYVKDVTMYKAYIAAADKAQTDNPQEAMAQLGYAKMLNANGPVNINARITEIQNAVAAKNNAKYFPGKSGKGASTAANQAASAQPGAAPAAGADKGQPASGPEDDQKKINGMLSDARAAEKQGNAAQALTAYGEVLKLQPGNQEAQTATTRLEQAIKTDPGAALSELKGAIRSFYEAQFEEARRALMDYLESPQTAQNPGVADFYLGATLIQRNILRTPSGQWKGPSEDAISAFKAARKANYNPVRTYVSPVVLKIWDSTAQ
jgi:hypothetical protein